MNGLMMWEGLTALFSAVLVMSVKASLAILCVLLARVLLRRAPKIFSYALWVVVLFRLLCPVAISSEFSVFGLFEAKSISDVASQVQEIADISDVDGEDRMILPENPGPGSDQEMKNDPEQTDTSGKAAAAGVYSIWLFGMVAMAAYSVVSLIRLKRLLSDTVKVRGNIYLSDHITSAFVIGLFRTRIYLPSGLSGHEREYILLHEQHHIRRGDHIIKLLAFASLCVHWFNPLVWLAFVLAGKDMEMSCDEAVIRQMGVDIRAEYSASLLSLATGRRIIAGTPLAFGEGDPKNRIRNLARWKKPAVRMLVIASLTCVVILISLITDPRNYAAQIRINGINYVLQEETVNELPESCYEMGTLESVMHRTTKDPEKDFSGTNLDEKYPGCMIYQEDGVTDIIYLEDYSGFYLVFKSALASPFHHTWAMDEIVFTFKSSYAYPKELAPKYSIRHDGEMFVMYGDAGIQEGIFEPYVLSKKKFDKFFEWFESKAEWTVGKNLASSIRRENVHAWKLDVPITRYTGDQPFYYLLQQKNGDVYLAHGYYDPQGPNDSFADDTYIDWMIRLALP